MLLTIARERIAEVVDPASDWKIVFLHTPKTAGMSFLELFRQRFGVDRVCWAGVEAPPEITAEHALSAGNRYKVVGGHVTFDSYAGFDRGRTLFVGVVREPVERALSYIAFMQRMPEHFPHDLSIGPMQAIGRSRAFRTEVSNMQCWFILGAHDFTAGLPTLRSSFFALCTLPEVNTMAALLTGASSLPAENTAKRDGAPPEPALLETLISLNMEDAALYEAVERGDIPETVPDRRMADLAAALDGYIPPAAIAPALFAL